MIRIGLVGAGTMGKTHQRAYKQLEGVRVAAVCDLDRAKAEAIARSWDARVYTSLEDMMREAELDAVDVCLPTDLHRMAVEAAAACGKHVFCEKPIAPTMADAQAMVDACRQADVTFMVGHVVRFFPEYRAARQQVLSQKLGDIGVVRTIRSGSFPWSEWFADYSRSGGPLLDLAIHDFDFLRWCFGPVTRVFSRTLGQRYERFDHTLTVLRFASGAMAHVEASWAYPSGAPFQTSIEIAGSKGLVSFDNQESYTIIKYGGRHNHKGAIESPLVKGPYALELEHFIRCIETKEVPLTSGEEALQTLRVALAAAESAATGKAIELEEVRP